MKRCSTWRVALPMLIAFVAWLVPHSARAQTPSPLQEWQYSSGVPFIKMYAPEVPTWQVVLGAAAEARPLYDGAQPYRVVGGPVINVRYKDIAFASTGEGIGVNLLHGENYRAGVTIGYDLGRRVSDDENHLRGLDGIPRAPVFKAFGSYVISKEFPLVFRADVRQSVARGTDGLVGDIGAYMPLPGSSERLVMFAGPSVTIASRKYLDKRFGVTSSESLASGYAEYTPRAGVSAAGFGLSATGFVTPHLLVGVDSAVEWLLGDARYSPLTQRVAQPTVAVSVSYLW
jgi:outer membrane scaffolding protein for murein synthesis (MipA/OmpV family)